MNICNKRGEFLVENVVFILLNLIFLGIVILFLVNQGSGKALVEEGYAKKIALLIDYSKPVMTIKIDMEDAKKIAEKNNINFKDIVRIEGNNVLVKLEGDKGKTYSFFNDVDVSVYPDVSPSTSYVIKINGYKNNE